MRKKSHISLAMYLVRELKLESLIKHKKAFCLGAILPDLTPKMITSPHEFETSYENMKDFVRNIFAENADSEWKERVLWRRIGVALHYMADYFTFPHNTSFSGSLKDHCMYESLEALFSFVKKRHRAYMQAPHSVERDCYEIVMLCSIAFVVMAELACAQNLVAEPVYRCA